MIIQSVRNEGASESLVDEEGEAEEEENEDVGEEVSVFNDPLLKVMVGRRPVKTKAEVDEGTASTRVKPDPI